MGNNNELIVNWYECSICGYMSRNLEKVKKCASQGKKNLYQIGQVIEFHFVGSNSYDLRKMWFKGEIKSISFFKLNHRASYMVLLSDSELPPQLFGHEMKVPEIRIRSLGGLKPAKIIELDK